MKIVDAIGSMEIKDWIRGILSAIISGGASGASAVIVLPSLSSDLSFFTAKWWIGIGSFFGISAFTRMLQFLNAHPLPDEIKTVVTTVETVKQTSPSTIVTSTKQETHVEPVTPAAEKEVK